LTKYRADIDGLRAIAVLAVVFFHAGVTPLGGGFVGVDVFFVISGYVIARRLLDDVNEERFSIADFYVRRTRRIFPALFFMVLATWLVACFMFLPPQFEDLSKSTLATGLFSSNFYFWRNSGYFDASALMRPLLHTWSLAVEEQYYVFVPIAMYCVARFGGKRWALFFIPATIASLALSIYATSVAPTANFFLLPTRAWELLLGALLVLVPLPPVRSRPMSELIGILGLAMITYAIFAFDEDTPFPGLNALFPCVGSALLIYAGEGGQRGFVTRLISLKPFVWVGLISYSMYLVHWPIIVFTRYALLREFTATDTILILIASTIAGYLSYRYIEQPFRHPRLGESRPVTLSAGAALMVVIAIVGSVGVFTKGLQQRFPGFKQIEIAGRDEWMTGTCFLSANQTWRDWDIVKCQRTSGHATNILLWGDSFAAHYVPGVVSRGEELSGNVFQYTAAGCRPILSFFSYSQPHCHEFNLHVLELIPQLKIKRIIIAARWNSLRARGVEDLRGTVEQLSQLGVTVEVIGQSPEFPIDVQTLDYREADAARSGQRSWTLAFNPRINQQISNVVGKSATFIDPLPRLCSGTICPYYGDAGFLYEDFGHFSAEGAKIAVSRYFVEKSAGNRKDAQLISVPR
jgi:peptidoglycan/LPS O-acetylase OafA/YrhL